MYDVVDKNGKHVVAAVRSDEPKVDHTEVNLVASVYGKNNKRSQKNPSKSGLMKGY